MTASRAQIRLLAALTALTLLVACGGDDSDSPGAAAEASESDAGVTGDDSSGDDGEADESSEETDEEADSDDDSGTGDASAGFEDVVDGEWFQGEAHVEVSGDEDFSTDFTTGGGFSDGGIVSLSWGEGGDVLGIALDGGGGGGVSFSTSEFGAGGTFPDQCTVNMTENSSSVLAGTFECHDVGAVLLSSSDMRTVDLEGRFELRA